MTCAEVIKMVDEMKKIEQSKLYDRSSIFKPNPPYNQHAKAHMAFAPFYPEMDKVGYNHKVHGNEVIPDYRVYNVERTAIYSNDVAKHLEDLKKAGLKDPWLRNHIWRVDPYCGHKKSAVHNLWTFLRPGILIGGGLALVHFLFKTGYEALVPPVPRKVERWWEERETPEPNEIYNRIKPYSYRYGVTQVSRDPRLQRNVTEDYGVVQKPPRQWYKKENDPALVGE